MSERGSKSKTKYIVICFFLALALPFSSFAADIFSLNEEQYSLIWNASNWNYFTQVTPSSSLSKPGLYSTYYMFDSSTKPSVGTLSSNGLSVHGRRVFFSHINTSRIVVRIPVYLKGLDGFVPEFFYGLFTGDNYGEVHSNLNSYLSIHIISVTTTDDPVPYIPYVAPNTEYIFNTPSSISSSTSDYGFFRLKRLQLDIPYSTVAMITIAFNISGTLPLPDDYVFFIGMSSNTELTSQDGQQQAVISGLSGIQGTIDGLVNDLQENDGKILDSLGNLEYILEGDAVTAAEAEQLVQDSLSKGEELGQLGDALASVPKPDINSVTSVIKPDIVLQDSDASVVQLAMSSIYSWDKLLAILGVLIAVVSISYILFGKKE